MKRALVSALALALIAGCADHGPEPKAEPASEARAVRVATVTLRPLEAGATGSGLLVPREEIGVSSELQGYRVQRVFVEAGDYVRQGQALMQLDPLLLDAPLAQAEAQVVQQRVALERAEREAARVEGLDTEGVLSEEAVAQRKAEARSARALLTAAQAQASEVRNRRARLTVRAPFSGLVIERTARPGDVAGGGSDAAFRIARDGLIEVEAEVREADLANVREGTTADVRLAGGTTIRGQVRRVSPAVDPQTRLGRVRVLLPRNAGARAGGFADVTFQGGSTPVAAVPESAIRFDDRGPRLTVLDARNRVQTRPVRTGRRVGGWVELIEGPPPGTRVVLGGAAFLLDGDIVRPTAATGAR